MILLPDLRTAPGMNVREHYMVRAKRVKAEKERAAWELARWAAKPPIPCVVVLTRFAPSNGLDDDNLAGSLKGVRDAVADWLGVDDRDRSRVRYLYEQQRAGWGVGIEFKGWPA
jgi:hypothetical protein